jgi:hypothetical protein
MKDPTRYLRMLNFKWLPKHIQHITEHIVFDKRNISFLAINALFRQYKTHKIKPSEFGNDNFMVKDFVPLQKMIEQELWQTNSQLFSILINTATLLS